MLSDNYDDICLDNFITSTKDNILHPLDYPHLELMGYDMTFPLYDEVNEICSLTCLASSIHYQHVPVQTTKNSEHGAINKQRLAKRTGTKIFQASTSEVYGDPEVHPKPENYWGKVDPLSRR